MLKYFIHFITIFFIQGYHGLLKDEDRLWGGGSGGGGGGLDLLPAPHPPHPSAQWIPPPMEGLPGPPGANGGGGPPPASPRGHNTRSAGVDPNGVPPPGNTGSNRHTGARYTHTNNIYNYSLYTYIYSVSIYFCQRLNRPVCKNMLRVNIFWSRSGRWTRTSLARRGICECKLLEIQQRIMKCKQFRSKLLRIDLCTSISIYFFVIFCLIDYRCSMCNNFEYKYVCLMKHAYIYVHM